ncbi:hypothetical protein BVI2075_320234 [Burkholderia vietnamiensis]|nr:hypothetical protein BVI2075_320234 [Burkholderia vietnamiensis]
MQQGFRGDKVKFYGSQGDLLRELK